MLFRSEKGYQEAAGYQDGKVVQVLGGGECQVSSTLFSAILYTDLDVYLLMATQLKADDIAVTKANIVTGEYMFALKNVANPNRMADCGLTRMTNDYLVQNELAPLVAGLASTNNNAFSMVKLSDLEMNYTNIYVSFKVNPITGDLVNLSYTYASYGKFTVRTNTLQVVGAATTTTTASYSNFVY